MDLEVIKKLVKLIDSSGITDFSVEDGETKIKISKRISGGQIIAQPVMQPAAAVMPAQPAQRPESPAAENTAEAEPSNQHEIRSPIVGTFYRAPTPDAEAFVKVGDTVAPGKVLCIIEAMKLMNEINADKDCRIVEICAKNGDIIEFGQTLFKVK